MKLCSTLFLGCSLLVFNLPSLAALKWYPGWQLTTSMNKERAGSAIVEVNGRIYAIGGVDGIRFLDSAEYSAIRADGTLSSWEMTSALNEQRGFFAAVAFNHFIYVAGGGNGPNGDHYLRSVERAEILPGGSLGPWVTERSMLVYPRRCAKLVIIGNAMYALGGFGGTLLDSVERAEILPDGSLGKWSLLENRMTMPRYINDVKKYQNAVYIIGGHDQTQGSGLAEVEFATIDDTNTLGVWRKTMAMGHPRYALSAAAHDDFLYALGGLHGAIYTDVIEKGIIDRQGDRQDNEHGGIRNWQATTPLSSLRADFGTVVYHDRIYIIGGTNRDGYYNTVEMASFNDAGDIGFMATTQQIAAIKKNAAVKMDNAESLPNRGTIKQIIQTELYSYIEVMQDDGTQWLAAPRSDFAVNDQVRFSRGLTMTDFHSKTLQRDFSSIIFVERVEKIASEKH